ncbi:PREDICTED: zinc finger [Prunus dulcis]|uniref:PREDICTED: zinc finger n=1 Tax=Prunus dulcis TaxID=3755 RepID=A0A5E4FVH7_PRUDU|nr:PREDICTED: zinc finger [Prunus dulcis]
MRECELCGLRARIHCEADQAKLCWDCDEKVHGANFLVAKHPRNLLCHGCQSPTPWMGSGPKLTPTVSVCEICVERRGIKFQRHEDQESEAENEDDVDLDDEEEDDDGGHDGEDVDDDADDDHDDDEDENQVVPWSSSHSAAAEPPPAVSCSSSEEEEEEEEFLVVSKRMRENADPDSDLGGDETSSLASLRLLKRARPGEENRLLSERSSEAELRSTAIVSSIESLQNQTDVISDGDDQASAAVLGICEPRRDVLVAYVVFLRGTCIHDA